MINTKKKLSLISSIFLLIFLLFFGCQDFIERNEIDDSKLSTRSSNYEHYYWHNGEKIELSILKDKKFILFNKSDQGEISNFLGEKTAFKKVVLSPKIKSLTNAVTSDLMWATVTATDKLSDKHEVLYEAPFFLSESGKELGLSHLFYVKLKSVDDLLQLKKIAEENKVEIIGNNEYMPLWYTLSCTKESKGNALDMANLFYEVGIFDSSQPDLMSDDVPECVNDTYFNTYQWNLRNTGQSGGTENIDINFCSVRSITQGISDVVVAVVDQGLQLDHPDLNVYSVSYNSETGKSPSAVEGEHGTMCAGFISARTNNSIGIAAASPNCPSMSISNTLKSSPDSRQKRADGINFAWKNGASVISNSWGSAVQYTIIDDAISSALTKGRSGKGCVVLFASGNDFSSSVSYPANSHPDIIAVGSINRNGSRSSFSNYGSHLDIVAPGEDVCSTTINSSYAFLIDGTSFACPTVASVAALILSVNQSLSQKEVVDIIERTARKVGRYNYTMTSGRTNGTWNNQMGYGLVDAAAAILEAQCVTANITNRNIIADETVTACNINVQNVSVSNNAKLSLNASEKISILPPFKVNLGSKVGLKIIQ